MAIPTIPDVKTLMEAGVHFGHASGKWHPKMKPYIFAARDRLHIIDLEKTREQLEKVLTMLEERVRAGKKIVLVGTKKQVANRIKEIGEKTGISYVNVRWLGGTLTNFNEIQKSISRMKKSEEFLASEEAATILKKERVRQEQELERMRARFGGLRELTRKPDVLFVIDPIHEHNALKEGRHQGMEILAVADTNADPSQVDAIIPANDDGVKSMNLILDLIEQTIVNGQKLISVKANDEKATHDEKGAGENLADVEAEKAKGNDKDKAETEVEVNDKAEVESDDKVETESEVEEPAPASAEETAPAEDAAKPDEKVAKTVKATAKKSKS